MEREPWQQDKVYVAQADRFFNQKNFDLAAQYYGKTKKSFEVSTALVAIFPLV